MFLPCHHPHACTAPPPLVARFIHRQERRISNATFCVTQVYVGMSKGQIKKAKARAKAAREAAGEQEWLGGWPASRNNRAFDLQSCNVVLKHKQQTQTCPSSMARYHRWRRSRVGRRTRR